jgi:hypothetical protein
VVLSECLAYSLLSSTEKNQSYETCVHYLVGLFFLGMIFVCASSNLSTALDLFFFSESFKPHLLFSLLIGLQQCVMMGDLLEFNFSYLEDNLKIV